MTKSREHCPRSLYDPSTSTCRPKCAQCLYPVTLSLATEVRRDPKRLPETKRRCLFPSATNDAIPPSNSGLTCPGWQLLVTSSIPLNCSKSCENFCFTGSHVMHFIDSRFRASHPRIRIAFIRKISFHKLKFLRCLKSAGLLWLSAARKQGPGSP